MRHVVERTAKAIISYELYRGAVFASIKRWYINDNPSSVMSKVEWSSVVELMTTIQRINVMVTMREERLTCEQTCVIRLYGVSWRLLRK